MISPGRSPCDDGVIAAADCEAPCAERARPFVLAATILGSSMAFIDGTVVNVALPTMQQDFGASVAAMQWVVGAYGLLLGALLLVGGSAGDLYGRRRVFVAGVAVFAVASGACAFAPSATTLILARGLQGVGGAMLVPGSLAIISASFPKSVRGRAIGTWAGFAALTTAAGPVLGGWLVDTLSWRAIFWINIPLAVLTIALAQTFVPESRSRNASAGLDWRGAALVTVGLGGVTYGMIGLTEVAGDRGLVWAALVLGVLALVLFLRTEARAAAPMLPLGLFRSAAFSGANVLTVFLYFGLSAALFLVPFNLIQVHGYSTTGAGAAFLPFTLILGLLSRWTGKLLDQRGARLPLVIGPAISAVGFLLLALPGTEGSYWATFFPAMVVLGVGMSIAVAPLTTTVMNAVGEDFSGVASGINNAASRTAGLLAVAAVGVLAVSLYGGALEPRLAALDLQDGVSMAVLAAREQLAATMVPGELDATTAAAVRAAIEQSFLTSFRWVMAGTAGFALLAAFTAAVTIPRQVRAD